MAGRHSNTDKKGSNNDNSFDYQDNSKSSNHIQMENLWKGVKLVGELINFYPNKYYIHNFIKMEHHYQEYKLSK